MLHLGGLRLRDVTTPMKSVPVLIDFLMNRRSDGADQSSSGLRRQHFDLRLMGKDQDITE